MNDRAAGMLGLLNKAGLVRFGPSAEKELKKGSLLLLASDASPKILASYETPAKALGLRIHYVPTKQELGAPLGRDELTAVMITSPKAAKSLLAKLQKGEQS